VFLFSPLSVASAPEGGIRYTIASAEKASLEVPVVVTPKPLLKPDIKEYGYAIRSNCWEYVKYRYPDFPSTKIINASLQKEISDVAVFKYSGVWHYTVVESFNKEFFTISETNYGSDTYGMRDIPYTDPALQGFFSVLVSNR
jgi:hypothetical protein